MTKPDSLLGSTSRTSAAEETIYLGVIPVATIQKGLVYTVYTDHLNTPRLISDSTGKAVWTWDNTDPFGGNEANEDPDGHGVKFVHHQRFAGQYFDAETQLHYNYFRYYDPATGRYVTSDSIGLQGGLNTYGYVGGNPLIFSDPFGLDATYTRTGNIIRVNAKILLSGAATTGVLAEKWQNALNNDGMKETGVTKNVGSNSISI